ncbi:MAG: hypothetical protein ACYDCN_10360 [Bacteroidia bacterium]
MSTNRVPIRLFIAIIKMEKKWGDRVIRIQAFLTKLTSNATFLATSWPPNIVSLAQFTTDVNTFLDAVTAVKNKTGTVGDRNAAFAVVMEDLKAIMTMVQRKANANISLAEGIITGAGYVVRTRKQREKQTNDAKNTEIAGTVLLTSDTPGHHEWEMSKDQVTIVHLPATSTAHTHVENLIPKDDWWFRNKKQDTKKRKYGWCGWIKLTIGAGGKTVPGGKPGAAGSMPTT